MPGIIWFVVLITTSSVLASNSDLFTLSHRTPHYYQANLTFAHVKQYLQHNLPFGGFAKVNDSNIALGVLCGITGKLVLASIINPGHYDPRAIINEYASHARQNYYEVARATNELLNEASKKTAPVINLINSMCSPTLFSNCNERIEARVMGNPYIYRMPAKLFIHLGKLSRNIMRNEALIENLINNNEVIQYMSQHVTDTAIEKLIKKIARTYTILKMMGTIYI